MISFAAAFGGEQVLHPYNLQRALKQVIVNKGSAGVDGMKVTELTDYFRKEKDTIIRFIREENYLPQAILGVELSDSVFMSTFEN
jgi:retron-type reverse transcriptase